jgi:hypothetical protein
VPRVFATFLKKGSAKNFFAKRFWAIFKNSTLDRDLFSVERFLLRHRGMRLEI